MTSPPRTSSPLRRTFWPGDAVFLSSNSSPQPVVFSTITTASAPSGMTPPVKIFIASPSPTLLDDGRPAGASSTTLKERPPSASALLTAYPSTAELSNGGESNFALTSSASASPCASASGTSSVGSRLTFSSTSLSASGYSMSFSKSCILVFLTLSLVTVIAVVCARVGGDGLILVLRPAEGREVAVLVELHLGGLFDDLRVAVREGL